MSPSYSDNLVVTNEALYDDSVALLPKSNPLCRDTKGNLYTVFTSRTDAQIGTAHLFMSMSEDGGVTWSTPETILTDGGSDNFLYPSIVADSDNVLHVVVYNATTISSGVHTTKAPGDISWSTPVTIAIAPSGVTVEELYLCLSSNDDMYVAAQINVLTPAVQVYKYASGIWDSGTTVTGLFDCDNLRLGVDASGNAHIILTEDAGTSGIIQYANSYDGPYTRYTLTSSNISDTNSNAIFTIDKNNKIHCAYAALGGSSNYPLRYFNFNIESSGTAPTISSPIDIVDTAQTTNTENLFMISCDTNDRIYIAAFESAASGTLQVFLSEDSGSSFSGIADYDISIAPDKVFGSISTLWPFPQNTYTNMPSSGMYTLALDLNTNDELRIFYDTDSTFESLPSENSSISGIIIGAEVASSSVSGYLLCAEPDQFVSGIITGDMLASGSISGFMYSIEEESSSVSGVLWHTLNDSSISGYMGNPDVNSNVKAFLLAANDDQFIQGYLEIFPGTNDFVYGYIGGINFASKSVSGYIHATDFESSVISGIIIGDEALNGSISGIITGISGTEISEISGFIRAVSDSSVSGWIFGISGIETDSISGVIVGHLDTNNNIKAITLGFNC